MAEIINEGQMTGSAKLLSAYKVQLRSGGARNLVVRKSVTENAVYPISEDGSVIVSTNNVTRIYEEFGAENIKSVEHLSIGYVIL